MNTLPLGLIRDTKNPALNARLAELEDYDLSSITKSCIQKYKWTPEKAAQKEREFKQFLALPFLDSGYYHIPEEDVDEYWHRAILHTVFYHDLCSKIFGRYYHHTPEPDPEHINQTNRDRTVKIFTYWFGTPMHGSLVKTCTQCKGPATSIDISLRPSSELIPK